MVANGIWRWGEERDWGVGFVGSMMEFGRGAWGWRNGIIILGGMLERRDIGFVGERRGGCRGGGIVGLGSVGGCIRE